MIIIYYNKLMIVIRVRAVVTIIIMIAAADSITITEERT